MFKPFSVLRSRCVPVNRPHIDTDQIVPARFLTGTTREGFGKLLFYDWRYDETGCPVPDFPLNDKAYAGEILLVGKNFGSGSSREHAAWAVADYGFRVVISSGFASIFHQNALQTGLLPVTVPEDFLQELFGSVERDPMTEITVDLPAQTVTNHATGRQVRFDINDFKKQCLLKGLDDVEHLTARLSEVEDFERRRQHIEILDTTLRDGEQTSGVSFTASEKLHMARMLLADLRVDRLEVGTARISDGEQEAVRRIAAWAWMANQLEKVEVLGLVDGGKSVEWIKQTGVRVMNLLCKGSLRHLTAQLHKTPEQHIADVRAEIANAAQQGLRVNVYIEDWSNGMRDSRDYVFDFISALQDQPVEHFMLSDTLGVLSVDETYRFCREMVVRYPKLRFDYHAHNDYGLAVANVLMAVKAGISGIHATVNGLGERAGNAPMASVMAALTDQAHVTLNLDEKKINLVSRMVESCSGVRIPPNCPVVGDNVFTQACGVHADGDLKAHLYYNELLPERFGRVRTYALGKTSGTSSVVKNLQELGISLEPEAMKKVTARIVALGDRKNRVTAEDLPYIIADVLHGDATDQKIKVHNFSLSVADGLRSVATLSIEIDGRTYEETSAGDGQYDAFMNALRRIYDRLQRELPRLTDYVVTIPPGGKTDALVETVITWEHDGRIFRTRGLDPDQTIAAIKATMKMLNIVAERA